MDFLDRYQDRKTHTLYTLAAEKKRSLVAVQALSTPEISIMTAYRAARKTDTQAAWNTFLERFQNSPKQVFVLLAKQHRDVAAALENAPAPKVTENSDIDFAKARDSGTVKAWDAFLAAYSTTPNAPIVLKARKQRDALIVALSLKDRDLAVEMGLTLTLEEKKHIVFVLHSKYDSVRNSQPRRFWSSIKYPWFRERDRQYLRKYAKSIGYPETDYLTPALADALLNEEFQSVNNDNWGIGRRKTHTDWISMVVNDRKDCRILTNATSVSGWSPYFTPQMTFLAQRSEKTKGLLNSDLVNSRGHSMAYQASVYALVDGRKYKLQLKGGRVMPRSRGGNLVSTDVTKAIRRGQTIEVIITNKGGAIPKKVIFSANGFTAAFNQMMKDCYRHDLRLWIR